MIRIGVKDLASLYGISERGIRKKIKNGVFGNVEMVGSKGGNSGKAYLIDINCLPQELQEKYYGRLEEENKQNIQNFTEAQREEACRKRNAVLEYEEFILTYRGKRKVETFIKEYNERNPDFQVAPNTFYKWKKLWSQRHDLADLVDTRGRKNKGESSISEEHWNYFYSLYMTQQQRSVKFCYDETFKKFHRENEVFPSYFAFYRKEETIPDAAICKYRLGQKAFKDGVDTYIGRSTAGLETNEIWQSDHHLCDVLVRDENNKVTRLWLTVWMDIKSRKIVNAFLRNGDPNTDTVLHSLHLGIKSTGYIPKKLYTDNGKDYKAKRGLRMDVPDSVSNLLGIKTIINAIPYNAQAKMIERFFYTLENQFGKTFQTYAGKNAVSRPEIVKSVPIEKYPTIEKFKELFYIWLEEYHNTVHSAKDMKDTPNHVYEEYLCSERRKADLEEVRFIFMKKEKRKVQQNGVVVNGLEFWDEKLVLHLGEYVNVLVEYENIQKVEIQDMEGRYICSATARVLSMYGVDAGQYEKIARERKKIRAIVNEYKPKMEVDIHQEIIDRALKQKQQAQEDAGQKGNAVPAEVLSPQFGLPAANTSKKILSEKEKEEQEEQERTENILRLDNMIEILKKKVVNDR